jgi:hypothetical protein
MMEKKILIGVIAITYCIISIPPVCFAETYSQKDGLFKIDVPGGWGWVEEPGQVMITNQKGDSSILIDFRPSPIGPEEKMNKEAAVAAMQAVKMFKIKPFGGTVISEEDTEIDGVYAYQLDYVLSNKYITLISFMNKGYRFGITCEAPQQNEERLKAKEILETFRF